MAKKLVEIYHEYNLYSEDRYMVICSTDKTLSMRRGFGTEKEAIEKAKLNAQCLPGEVFDVVNVIYSVISQEVGN